MSTASPYLVVLGTAQDGGYPQAGCRRACCEAAWRDPSLRRRVACLAVVDPRSGGRWLVDATPDFGAQLRHLDEIAPSARPAPGLEGIVLTHGHVGHYTGLVHLGREVMGADRVPVWCTARLADFLRGNGPWDQLARFGHVDLRSLDGGAPLRLAPDLALTAFEVPHRAEVSETLGLRVEGPRRSALYAPDTDSWDGWEPSLEARLASVDVAYLDGTFLGADELEGRDVAEVPHPTIAATMARLAEAPPATRAKVRFTHLNHTNAALAPGSAARAAIEAGGFAVAAEGEVFAL